MENTWTVYAIQHNVTGKIYVGITRNVCKDRIKAHLSGLRSNRHTNVEMQADFNEFGEDYSYYVLEKFDYPDYPYGDERRAYPMKREKEWMLKIGTNDPKIGYNANDRKFVASINDIDLIEGVPKRNE